MRYARIAIGEYGFCGIYDEQNKLWQLLAGVPFEGVTLIGKSVPEADAKLLAPVTPSKVVCVGLNYRDHIEEMKHDDVPEDPVLFIKPSTSVIGPGEDIVRPANAQRVDFEAELAVVIGKTMKDVSPEDALSYVFGYTCLNDVTERVFQKKDGQWTRGKDFDTFCPIGPWIETDIDPANADVESRLNGKTMQKSNTRLLITSVAKLLSHISGVMTLLPGDVVATGTPAGVGPIVSGDEIVIAVCGIGELHNQVK